MNIDQVRELILADPLLVPEYQIRIIDAREAERTALIKLYEDAFNRGDWFGSTCEDTNVSHVSSKFVHNHCSDKGAAFFVFVDSTNQILGAAALRSTDSGLLLDEAQIDPRGRRKGIISAYSRRIVPILDLFGRYWTEFLLTPNSRIVRKILIGELGLIITGLKPAYYLSRTTGRRYSVLVAYGPHSTIGALLERAPRECVGELLDIIRGIPYTKPAISCLHNSSNYEEVIVDWGDNRAFHDCRARGFLPVDCNPYSCKTTLAKFPVDKLLSLHFLAREGIDTIVNLLGYCGSFPSQTDSAAE